MKEDNKRWLMSMMKTAGSRRNHLLNGSNADERHLTKQSVQEDLPNRARIKHTQQFYNGKINYDLLVRFLRGQVGNNWYDVYSEILTRIPTKLLDRKDMIYWIVADKVTIIEGRPWNKKSQKFILTEGEIELGTLKEARQSPERKEFYVDPASNEHIQIPQKPSRG